LFQVFLIIAAGRGAGLRVGTISMRIVYLCPALDTPFGGIKVIYRHAEQLAALGVEACVLHPSDPAFSCTWFSHQAKRLREAVLDRDHDFVIVPEIWAAAFGRQCVEQQLRFAIFAQNPYLLTDDPPELARLAYRQAELVLVISEDCERMVLLNDKGIDPARLLRVIWSVPEQFLAGRDAVRPATSPTISFMPRKLPNHSRLVVAALREHLPPHWQIRAIDGVDEATVAAMLRGSRIFLSFSEFEGLPLPPVEAALAGNLVIGYTGRGGREYWNRPNFLEIEQGDIHGFVMAARQAVRNIDEGRLTRDDLAPGIARLAARYSAAAERDALRLMLERIERPRDAIMPTRQACQA